MLKGGFVSLKEKNTWSLYYTAQVKREQCWVLSAALKGTENVAFDRTLDKNQSIFEFFVPADTEPIFLKLMDYMIKQGVVISLQKTINRLITEEL